MVESALDELQQEAWPPTVLPPPDEDEEVGNDDEEDDNGDDDDKEEDEEEDDDDEVGVESVGLGLACWMNLWRNAGTITVFAKPFPNCP